MTMLKLAPVVFVLLSTLFPGRVLAGDNYLPSLITVKKQVRAVYSQDGAILIEAAEVIAIEFGTIAAANNYWRECD